MLKLIFIKNKIINMYNYIQGHYVTNRKVAGSTPDEMNF
jgi:hypothetical protein